MKTRIALVIAALALLAVAACIPPSPQQMAVVLDGSQLTVAFQLPPSLALSAGKSLAVSNGRAARVVDPNTAALELWLSGTKNGTLSFFDGVRSGTAWTGTFKGVTAGTYAAGTVVVKLLDRAGNPLTAGTNTAAVTITRGAQNAVTVKAVPDASLVTNVTVANRYAVQVGVGASRYYKIPAKAASGYQIRILHPDVKAQVVLYNEDGTIMYDYNFLPCAFCVDGPGQDQAQSGFWCPQAQNVYMAVYPQGVDSSAVFHADMFVTDRTADMVICYEGDPAKPSPDNHGAWELTGNALNVSITQGWTLDYRFLIMNTSGENVYFDLTGGQGSQVSLGAVTGPATVTIPYQPGTTRMEGGNTDGFVVRIAAPPASSGTGSAVIQIPTTLPGKQSYSFTLNYTINDGSARTLFWSKNVLVASGSTLDIGDVPLDRRVGIPLNIENRGTGPVTLSSLASSDPNIKMSGDAPSLTVNSKNSSGVLDLDLSASHAAIEGQSYTANVSLALSGDPNLSSVSFTIRYRALLCPPDTVWLLIGSPTTSAMDLNWIWSAAALPDATSFRVYRSTSWEGPYAQVGTVTLAQGTAVSPSDIAANQWPGDAVKFTYHDTGLGFETRYYYNIDAVLGTGVHPVTHTALTWWNPSFTTYDSNPAVRSIYDSNDWWHPYALSLGTQITTWFYPKGETSIYTFTPTPGKRYSVTVTNVSLTHWASLWFWDGTSAYGYDSLDRWGNQSVTFTWDAAGFDTTKMVRVGLGASDDCSGGYTILVEQTN